LGSHHYIFDERFAEAFLHKPHRVFGIKLKPFSTWHRLQLEWIDSKMLLGSPSKWDVYAAAKICSTDYPNAANVTTLRGVRAVIWKIRYLLTPWKKEVKRFYDYLDDYASPPKLWGGKSSSRKKLAEAYEELYAVTKDPDHARLASRTHYEASLQDAEEKQIDDTLHSVSAYVHLTGRSPKEAWDMPIGELGWMSVALAKREGAEINIWTPMDEEFFQKNLIQRREKIAIKAKELAKEHPELPQEVVNALAPVKYWQEVCERQKS